VALIKSPNDRILVIYGAGHLGWLRQMIANDSAVRLRKLADFESRGTRDRRPIAGAAH